MADLAYCTLNTLRDELWLTEEHLVGLRVPGGLCLEYGDSDVWPVHHCRPQHLLRGGALRRTPASTLSFTLYPLECMVMLYAD